MNKTANRPTCKRSHIWEAANSCARALTLIAFVAASPVPADPFTLDTLFHLPVEDAAAWALGPGPEDFVERSTWNDIEPDFVLNPLDFYRMSFFTRPKRIAPGVCAVVVGRAIFNIGPAPEDSFKEWMARIGLPYDRRPLRPVRVERVRRYFAAGPAPATPRPPAGDRKAPRAAASDSCKNPVSARNLFEASSPRAAILAVTRLKAAIAAAHGRGSLTFALTSVCGKGYRICAHMRKRLAALKPQGLRAIGQASCADIDQDAAECASFHVQGAVSDRYDWDVTIAYDPDGRIRTVHLTRA